MSWDYRLIRHRVLVDARECWYLAIHLVHYDRPGSAVPNRWSAEPVSMTAIDHPEEFYMTLLKVREALKKPVLQVRNDHLVIERKQPAGVATRNNRRAERKYDEQLFQALEGSGPEGPGGAPSCTCEVRGRATQGTQIPV